MIFDLFLNIRIDWYLLFYYSKSQVKAILTAICKTFENLRCKLLWNLNHTT